MSNSPVSGNANKPKFVCSCDAGASCTRERNKLRTFIDEDDLLDHNDNAQIVEWVNKYAEYIGDRRTYHRKYQNKKRLLIKAAQRLLDQDELARVEQLADRIAAEKLDEEEI